MVHFSKRMKKTHVHKIGLTSRFHYGVPLQLNAFSRLEV